MKKAERELRLLRGRLVVGERRHQNAANVLEADADHFAATVATLTIDSGTRYLSTDIYR